MDLRGKIERLLLVVRCIIEGVFFGAADQVPEALSRVVVVPTGKLGDVVCTTPVLRAIRSHFPHVHIIVAGTSSLHRALLSDSGLVDEYVDLEEKNIVSRLKTSALDAAFVTGPSFRPTALLYLARVPLVVAPRVEGGFSPSETRPYRILQKYIKTYAYDIHAYAPRERLRVLESLGVCEDDTTKELGYSEQAAEKIKHFFQKQSIKENDFLVGISPSAGNKIKEWPVDRFGEVADYVQQDKKGKVVIIGGLQDQVLAESMKRGMKTKAIDATGLFNIDELKALIANLSMFIAVDTGPIYIAEAFSVPTIDIVGPVDENVQPPRGFIHRNVVPLNRTGAQLSILNARLYNRNEALRQVLSITVLDVKREIDSLLWDLDTSRNVI